MKKQIGNDVRLEWTILRKGVAEDFADATDLSLTAFIPNLSVDEVIIPIAKVGNVFTLNIPTTDLAIGTYTIRLQYKKLDPAFVSGKASISTAVNSAFQIVPIGASEDDLNDELTSNVVYCTDGATFIPSVSVVGNEIILSWTNDKGYENPLPINIKGDKGDVGKSAYEYYLESTTEPTPLTEAEFSTMLGNLPTYVQDVILATSNANNAATNANNAATTATQAAEDADAATLLANAAADNANTKATYAQTQGDYANATNDSVQAAENLRASAESSRVTAESNRVSQENDRINADNVRVSNEDDRISAENARVTAESGRVTAENGRVTAENDRVQNDIYRGKYLRAAEYDKRVTTDSGTIRDRNLLNAMYDDALNLLPNTDLWYNLECGIKTRVSGLNTYVSKVYDLSTNNRDASQTTEASQPYLVSNINPANRLAIWGLNRLLPLSSSVAKITTDKWTIAVNVKSLGGLCEFIGSTNTRLSVTTAATDSVIFKNESGTSVSLNLLSKIVGTSARLYFVAKGDGTMQIWSNGVLQGTLSNPTNATFANLYGSANGELKAIRLFNKDLNKSEIEFLDAKMAAYYPPFEGVTIGNQVWEASNAMDTVTPDGTVIPEVTDSTAWAALTTPAWCYYNNSEANGAVYGRQYNNYAVVKLTGSPIWRVPMKADFDQLATFLGDTSVAGGKLKTSGLTYWNSPNTGATNESGFAAIGGSVRNADGGFSIIGTIGSHWGGTAFDANNAYRFHAYYGVASITVDSTDKKRGMYLRRLRRVPSGDLVREISSGVFTTNITGGTFKDIAVPNMYKITGVKVTSAQALTNFTLEARTAAGVLVQNLLSGKSIGAGKSVIFSVVADMEVMLQDYIARATAGGNGGAGMEIELIIEKIKVQ